MAVEKVKDSSHLSYPHHTVGSHEARITEAADKRAREDNVASASSVIISAASMSQDFVTTDEDRLKMAQSRFEAIESDEDGRASQEALIAIRNELRARGRNTSGLDRAIASFSEH